MGSEETICRLLQFGQKPDTLRCLSMLINLGSEKLNEKVIVKFFENLSFYHPAITNLNLVFRYMN